ncbi:DUF3630 family protein [Ferrimonas senticii]|uniref:DUF3630 family protein n=1 Tax=Ferrimonas senticii TaxID=394566 RepID=UPI00042724B2|nr:DUF3630 family protein [Ferrimonas senticii]
MEPNTDALLQQLTAQVGSASQLLWHCPLSQEQVLQIVPQLMARLDCRLGAVQQGADRLFWPVRFEDAKLTLQFEAVCDSLWLEGPVAEIQFLAKLNPYQ